MVRRLPVGILLLASVLLIGYFVYPPEVKQGDEVPSWAAKELVRLGGAYVDATTAALIVISLMVITGVVTWAPAREHVSLFRRALSPSSMF